MLRKILLTFISIIFTAFITPKVISAESLLWTYGPASINNTNGFLIDYIANRQVYFPFIAEHVYRLDLFGAVNPNTFWIGLCNDKSICNTKAGNYRNRGDFSVEFINNSEIQWFDVWGNCEGFGPCSLSGAKLYDITSLPSPRLSIVNHVINDNGGTKIASDFTINVTAADASPSSFFGSESGTDVTLTEGSYNVTENILDGYSVSYSNDCSGTIANSETKTCTITNDDIAPPPVTKVILIPGLGASWNAKAMLSCGPADDAGWSIAPYAAGYYNPIIAKLGSAQKEVIPFYYDWRNRIQNNSSLLATEISKLGTEKVNVIAHSMGGLVARDFVQNYKTDNIDRLEIVGTPNQGAVLAYPAWVWGDVWSDNFIQKVALNLYLKACGNKGPLSNNITTIHDKFPSIGDLLPTSIYGNYLQDRRGDEINSSQNNSWLNSLNLKDFPSGITLGTLSGNSFNTLQKIVLKNAEATKASGKIITQAGDGTVLAESSQLPSYTNLNYIIDAKHSDLIASESGMMKIFEFLGFPYSTTNTASSYQEPNSALIVISYPANFWLVDLRGNSIKDSAGMVSIINPKSGSYKLALTTNSQNTPLVVAQFLPNGDIKYKEYNLQGLGPKFKTLNFSLENPRDDILN